jgi:replicative DNA helicase
LGAFGAIKQSADVILAIYPKEMYRPAQAAEGGSDLIVAKNHEGPTGLVEFYYRPRILRFEDMLDPS